MYLKQHMHEYTTKVTIIVPYMHGYTTKVTIIVPYMYGLFNPTPFNWLVEHTCKSDPLRLQFCMRCNVGGGKSTKQPPASMSVKRVVLVFTTDVYVFMWVYVCVCVYV